MAARGSHRFLAAGLVLGELFVDDPGLVGDRWETDRADQIDAGPRVIALGPRTKRSPAVPQHGGVREQPCRRSAPSAGTPRTARSAPGRCGPRRLAAVVLVQGEEAGPRTGGHAHSRDREHQPQPDPRVEPIYAIGAHQPGNRPSERSGSVLPLSALGELVGAGIRCRRRGRWSRGRSHSPRPAFRICAAREEPGQGWPHQVGGAARTRVRSAFTALPSRSTSRVREVEVDPADLQRCRIGPGRAGAGAP